MRAIATVIACLLLAGCGDNFQFLTKEKLVVVVPKDDAYRCPDTEPLPDPATLTELQVARLLRSLHAEKAECKNSLKEIKQFLEDQKKKVEKSN